MTPLERAPDYVQVILNGLRDRSGFDDWWSSLDDDLQQEVINDIRGAVGH